MSGGTLHIHVPHDHELQHAQQHAAAGHDKAFHHGIAGGSIAKPLALFTAVIATLAAVRV